MTTIATPDMKRGESFSYEAEIIVDGVLTDIPVENLRSQVKTKVGKLLGECSVVRISTGKYRFFINDTDEWPVGDIEFDFDITTDGITTSSPTFTKKVLKDITRPIVEVTP